jgi:hypothetical protein
LAQGLIDLPHSISTDKPPPATTGAKNNVKMASDEDYAAFLDKANEDPNAGASATREGKRKVELKTVDEGLDVPAVLKRAARDEFYVSDSDEPFVPVCVKGPDDVPDERLWSPSALQCFIELLANLEAFL